MMRSERRTLPDGVMALGISISLQIGEEGTIGFRYSAAPFKVSSQQGREGEGAPRGEVIDRPKNLLGKKRALFFMYSAQKQIRPRVRRLRLLALGVCPGSISVILRKQPFFPFA